MKMITGNKWKLGTYTFCNRLITLMVNYIQIKIYKYFTNTKGEDNNIILVKKTCIAIPFRILFIDSYGL